MSEQLLPGILVPMDQLSEVALNGLIEEFILREGTDYGHTDYSLEDKKSHVYKQLKAGQVLVVFDPNEETSSIMRKEALR